MIMKGLFAGIAMSTCRHTVRCRPNRCRPKLGCRPNWELRNYRDQMWIDQIGFGQIVQQWHTTTTIPKMVPNGSAYSTGT